MISLVKADYLHDIPVLKMKFIESCIEPLESSLEELIAFRNTTYIIKDNGNEIGYCCLGEDSTLLQFYLEKSHELLGPAILKEVIDQLELTEALVCTRDTEFLSYCLEEHKDLTVTTHLFIDSKKIITPEINSDNMIFRLATPADLDSIRQACGDFYDYLDATLERSIQRGEIFVLYRENDLLGTGSLVTTHCQEPYAEIGMSINKAHYKKGIGTYIVSKLKEYCYTHQLKPICNCDADNMASRNTLEKAGFIVKDKIIKVTF